MKDFPYTPEPGAPALRRFPELDGATFLIGLGGTKCATSWLYWYLHSIPEVRCSAIKELNYFSARFTDFGADSKARLAMDRLLAHLQVDGDPVANLHARPHFRASVDCVRMLYDENAYLDHFVRIRKPATRVGSSRVDLQACKLEYSIVSPK